MKRMLWSGLIFILAVFTTVLAEGPHISVGRNAVTFVPAGRFSEVAASPSIIYDFGLEPAIRETNLLCQSLKSLSETRVGGTEARRQRVNHSSTRYGWEVLMHCMATEARAWRSAYMYTDHQTMMKIPSIREAHKKRQEMKEFMEKKTKTRSKRETLPKSEPRFRLRLPRPRLRSRRPTGGRRKPSSRRRRPASKKRKSKQRESSTPLPEVYLGEEEEVQVEDYEEPETYEDLEDYEEEEEEEDSQEARIRAWERSQAERPFPFSFVAFPPASPLAIISEQLKVLTRRVRSPSLAASESKESLVSRPPSVKAAVKAVIRDKKDEAKRTLRRLRTHARNTGQAISSLPGFHQATQRLKGYSRLSKRAIEELPHNISDLTDKDKRFLAALLGLTTGLLGVMGGALYVGKTASRSDLTRLAERNRAHFVAEDHQLAALGLSLNDTLLELHETESTLMWYMLNSAVKEHAQLFLSTTNLYLTHLESLQDRRLSPELIDFDSFMAEYSAIAKELEAKGLTPIISDPMELLGLDVGHSFNFTTLTVQAVVGVPAEWKGSQRLLKRYIPFPLRLGSQEEATYVLPDLVDTLVAVHPDAKDRSDYRTVTSSELATCHRHGTHFFCRPDVVEMVISSGDCLASLLEASQLPDGNRVPEACRFRAVNGSDISLRTGENSYRLFLSSRQRLSSRCQGSTRQLGVFSGLFDVWIPPTCVVSTSAMDLHGGAHLGTHHIAAELHELELVPSDAEATAKAFASIHKARAVAPYSSSLGGAQDWLDRESSLLTTQSSLVHIGLAVLGGIISIGVLIVVVHVYEVKPLACLTSTCGIWYNCITCKKIGGNGSACSNASAPPQPINNINNVV